MLRFLLKRSFWFGFSILLLLTNCTSSQTTNAAPAAIEGYLHALVDKDLNQMIYHSCAAWEAQAKLEFDSFTAVKATWEDSNCEEKGQEGDITLVNCSGVIIASYGAEDLEIELGARIFVAVKEAGEWRMCGYR
jgi:hypothetical protein